MRQAAEYLVQARAPLFPSVGIGGTGGLKASGGGGDPSSALQGVVAAASWELDLWGRVRYGKKAAAEDNVSAQADYEFARQSIAASVAKAWFTAIQLTQQARLAGEMVGSSGELAKLAGDRERVGAGSDVDTAVARANLHNLEDARAQAEYGRDQALRALELLLGRYPRRRDRRQRGLRRGAADAAGGRAAVDAGAPARRDRRRAARGRRLRSHRRAKAAMLPQITLNLNFGAFESDILELKEDFENPSGGAGARLLAPIYMGGRLKANVHIRTLQQEEAVANYAGTAFAGTQRR
jgi:outer membrane protein TolC